MLIMDMGIGMGMPSMVPDVEVAEDMAIAIVPVDEVMAIDMVDVMFADGSVEVAVEAEVASSWRCVC